MQQGVDAAGVDLRRCYEKAEKFPTREAVLEGGNFGPLGTFFDFYDFMISSLSKNTFLSPATIFFCPTPPPCL